MVLNVNIYCEVSIYRIKNFTASTLRMWQLNSQDFMKHFNIKVNNIINYSFPFPPPFGMFLLVLMS